MKKNDSIIIDTDGGADDYMAILLAMETPELRKKVLGITTVFGNTDIEHVNENVFKALNDSNSIVPVYQGSSAPIKQYPFNTKDGAFGGNGLGDVEYQKVKTDIEKEDAVDYLIRMSKEKKGNLKIIAIGPLTNIAKAIQRDPEFVNSVNELIIMGGDEYGGNIQKFAEFNFHNDPDAAKAVFEAGFKNIEMVGFNITKQVTFGPAIEQFLQQAGERGEFLYDITRTCAELDRRKNGTDGTSVNDPLVVAMLLKREILKFKKASVEITSNPESYEQGKFGQSTVKDSIKSNTQVAYCVDKIAALKTILNGMFPGREGEIDKILEEPLKNKAIKDTCNREER